MTRRACDSRIARSTAAWALLLLHVARAATADDASALLGATPPETVSKWHAAAGIRYRVVIDQPQTQYARVEIDADTRGKRSLDFAMPAWRPGRYEILDPAGGVTGVTARTPEGRPLEIERIDKQTWRVPAVGTPQRVILEYRLYANELGLRTRHIDDTHAFLSGSAALMYVDKRRAEPVSLVLDVPADWRIATGLDAVPGRPRTFAAPSYDVLIDCPIEAGEHAARRFGAADRDFDVVIWGGGGYDIERITRDLRTLVEEQCRFWGDAPFGRYVFLIHAMHGAGGGTEHLNSTIMQVGRDFHAPEKNYRDFLLLASHEFFHTWNVKRLRPAGLVPYDLTRENYTDLLWVAEGTTSYYEALLLARCGLLKPRQYFKHLSELIESHEKRPGRREQSLADSSFDAWVKFNKPHDDSFNTTVSFYSKGELVSLLLDLELRGQTGNRVSLDDVLRDLYRRFPLSGKGFSSDDLLKALNTASAQDFGDFFRRYVNGTDELPLEAALQHAGLLLEREPGKDEDEKEEEEDEGGPTREGGARMIFASPIPAPGVGASETLPPGMTGDEAASQPATSPASAPAGTTQPTQTEEAVASQLTAPADADEDAPATGPATQPAAPATEPPASAPTTQPSDESPGEEKPASDSSSGGRDDAKPAADWTAPPPPPPPAQQSTTAPSTAASTSAAASAPPKVRAELGAELRDDEGLARVTRVYADQPAYTAGLQVDDLIVALDGVRLRADDLEKRLKSRQPGERVRLTILRRDLLRELHVPLGGRPNVKLVIRHAAAPTELQKAIYKSWLGQDWPAR